MGVRGEVWGGGGSSITNNVMRLLETKPHRQKSARAGALWHGGAPCSTAINLPGPMLLILVLLGPSCY